MLYDIFFLSFYQEVFFLSNYVECIIQVIGYHQQARAQAKGSVFSCRAFKENYTLRLGLSSGSAWLIYQIWDRLRLGLEWNLGPELGSQLVQINNFMLYLPSRGRLEGSMQGDKKDIVVKIYEIPCSFRSRIAIWSLLVHTLHCTASLFFHTKPILAWQLTQFVWQILLFWSRKF